MATSDTKTKNYYYFIIGALFFLVGIIPYLAVNKPPHPYGYGFSMRHTLLLPLGSSLIIIGLIGVLLVVNKAKYAIGGSIIALFMTMNIYNYYSADMDWYKQLAIINGLQEIKSEVSSKSILVFNDQLKDYNWLNRNIAILEYDGYINQIFNTNDKLGVSQEDYNRNYHQATLASILKYKEYYYLSAFQEDGETVFLNVDSPSKIKKPTLSNWAQLKIYEIFKPQEFNTKLEEVLDIKVNVVS